MLSSGRALAYPLAHAALHQLPAHMARHLPRSAQLQMRPCGQSAFGTSTARFSASDQLVQWDSKIIADLTLIPLPPNGGTSLAIYVAEASLPRGRGRAIGREELLDV